VEEAPLIAGHRFNFADVYYYVNGRKRISNLASPPPKRGGAGASAVFFLATIILIPPARAPCAVVYWTLLLASLLTGNPLLERISHFENFVTAMFGCSVAFTGYFAARWVQDAKKQLQGEQRRDARGLLRFGWKAIFWLAFVLWYVGPQYEFFTDWCATAGGVACLSGLALVVSGALTVGEWSFMGEPQIPRHLATGGPYALLRHPQASRRQQHHGSPLRAKRRLVASCACRMAPPPALCPFVRPLQRTHPPRPCLSPLQALGNILFLVGFSAAGGAVLAAATFLASFALYCRAVVPKEEAMLEAHFGESYRRYKERVPAFGYALVLLLLVEVILIWRFAPFSLPVGPIVPRPLT
jgi:protein-S-isoprenylcysteine O-methyltransferase Ste14